MLHDTHNMFLVVSQINKNVARTGRGYVARVPSRTEGRLPGVGVRTGKVVEGSLPSAWSSMFSCYHPSIHFAVIVESRRDLLP